MFSLCRRRIDLCNQTIRNDETQWCVWPIVLTAPISSLLLVLGLKAECGIWHCAALILVPPCKDGGYVSNCVCFLSGRMQGAAKIYRS